MHFPLDHRGAGGPVLVQCRSGLYAGASVVGPDPAGAATGDILVIGTGHEMQWGASGGGSISTIAGTTNQITATTAGSSVVLSLPSTVNIPGALHVNNGSCNIQAVGGGALAGQTTGTFNCALGYTAGSNLTNETNCTFIGNGAVLPAIGNSNQVVIGNVSVDKIAFGDVMDYGNTTAGVLSVAGPISICTGAGKNSVLINTDANPEAQANVAISEYSLENAIDANYNIAIGSAAINALQTGDDNVGIGREALNNITTSQNVGIGALAGSNITTESGCIAIGYNAQINTGVSNQLVIGSTSINKMKIGDIMDYGLSINNVLSTSPISCSDNIVAQNFTFQFSGDTQSESYAPEVYFNKVNQMVFVTIELLSLRGMTCQSPTKTGEFNSSTPIPAAFLPLDLNITPAASYFIGNFAVNQTDITGATYIKTYPASAYIQYSSIDGNYYFQTILNDTPETGTTNTYSNGGTYSWGGVTNGQQNKVRYMTFQYLSQLP
jgi:hypothetical protein